jgi:hypothetical protein
MPPDTVDPIADALRPGFVRAAQEIREILRFGGTGDVSVLFGHLPKAAITIVGGRGPDERMFNMSIPSVVGRPDDPESIPSFVTGIVKLDMPAGMSKALEYVSTFELSGPQILANTVRSCVFGLVNAGIGHEDLGAVVRDAVAFTVMKG